jgi:hypothetical protein
MYNLIIQRDSRLNMEAMEQSRQIADESRKIAHLTRRDSTDMRIIAVVTMLFLPGTFTAVRSSPFLRLQSRLWLTFTIKIRPYSRHHSLISTPKTPLPWYHGGYGFTA